MGDTFARLAEDGPLLLAFAAAALAGLVSFLSPCILPLVPGYLSYVTGLAGADLGATGARQGTASSGPAPEGAFPDGGGGVAVASREARAVKGRVLAGTMLFIAGFTVVYVLSAILVASVGRVLLAHRRPLEIGVGVLIILLGLAYLGLVPGLQREFRIQRLPAAGLIGAPVFGAVFALSWLPCSGPTLGAVLGMAAAGGQTDRAALLAVAYCLGLGLPFVIFGLAFRRLLGVFKAVRRNSAWVTRIGGALLIVIGLALVTGGWLNFVIWLQTTFGVGEVSI
ncbi:cytochrome c biogenesis CcdA family protein [Micromonospora sp. NBC_01796]|uniref:cytochrome c biogenesis CcdA family protein n=1 Tax=Micromonospora sp. NBC_01796 TaxID=2975987 RepID=UPI002DDB9FD7|nr:cytochrome c biogenesis protein CcdA [Micromonospora sp. NBC_01796]WSA88197.1 cytochrome c biogenesis protein CcdA [Micromonospora sp. NBC_01796]